MCSITRVGSGWAEKQRSGLSVASRRILGYKSDFLSKLHFPTLLQNEYCLLTSVAGARNGAKGDWACLIQRETGHQSC